MRRKSWSSRDIVETMQVQNFREMGPTMIAGGEGGTSPPSPESRAAAELLELARNAGGEGGGTSG
jgi:hypothetical protein